MWNWDCISEQIIVFGFSALNLSYALNSLRPKSHVLAVAFFSEVLRLVHAMLICILLWSLQPKYLTTALTTMFNIHTVQFFLIAIALFLSQNISFMGVNGSVHIVRQSVLQKNADAIRKKSHSVNGPLKLALTLITCFFLLFTTWILNVERRSIKDIKYVETEFILTYLTKPVQ